MLSDMLLSLSSGSKQRDSLEAFSLPHVHALLGHLTHS